MAQGVRKVITDRQRIAASLLCDGLSGYKALKAAGYSRWTAKRLGAILRDSWGLRQALIEEQERRAQRFRVRAKRVYDRPRIARVVTDYCRPEFQEGVSNQPLEHYHGSELAV